MRALVRAYVRALTCARDAAHMSVMAYACVGAHVCALAGVCVCSCVHGCVSACMLASAYIYVCMIIVLYYYCGAR